ncbi:MAG: dihydrodipicolinate synthase family protein [Oligosphaeraceae bacterium]|nr:dihydrodipicolinate synthase family protein [Oligosphaeraceae bacterium]
MKSIAQIDPAVLVAVRQGTVIPAMPLALNAQRQFQPRYQRALCRYYIAAGAGGIAVGVHSTQFEIRRPEIGLFEPVLRETSSFIDEYCRDSGRRILKVAGICGKSAQALKEADFALQNGYDAGLLSLAAFAQDGLPAMLEHCRILAEKIPIIGFYLQPSVGGRILPYEFWRDFCCLDNILAIKMAPFNRYQTFDVVRALAESGRDITLYTGNDDNIVVDLLTEYKINTTKGLRKIRIRGGLLGHWCCWTAKAVELLREVHTLTDRNADIPAELLTRAAEITDANAAFFDPAHSFAGCIPGIHEVLRRQGLLPGTWCLNPKEVLSPGQAEEITRVHDAYPHLHDDAFVARHLSEWLA